MGKSEEMLEVKGLTAKALVIGVILSILLAFFWTFTFPPANMPNVSLGTAMYGAASAGSNKMFANLYASSFALLFIVGIVAQAARKKINRSEALVIFVMVLVSTAVCMGANWRDGTLVFPVTMTAADIATVYDDFLPILKDVFEPWWTPPAFQSASFKDAMFIARSPVPWGDWALVIARHITWVILLSLTFLTFSMIFVKPFQEVEELSFPMATPTTLLLGTKEGERSVYKTTWTYVGIIIGLLLSIPTILWIAAPAIGLVRANLPTMYVDYSRYVPWVTLYLTWEPFLIGVGTFLPTQILMSFLVAWVAMVWIMPYILSAVGVFQVWSPGRTLWGGGEYPGLFITSSIAMGAIVAASAYTLYFHKKYLMSVIQGKEGKLLRNFALMTGVLVIVYTVFATVIGADWWSILIAMVLMLLVTIGFGRLTAETGWFGLFNDKVLGANLSTTSQTIGLVNMVGNTGPLDRGVYATLLLSPATSMFGGGAVSNRNPFFYSLDLTRTGRESRTNWKEILYACAIGIVVSVIVGTILATWSTYYWGIWTQGAWSDDTVTWYTMAGTKYYGGPWSLVTPGFKSEPLYLQNMSLLTATTVFCLVCYYLRRKMPSFWFNPIVLFLIAFSSSTSRMLFLPVVIALVVKMLSIRFLGVRVTEEKLYPLALGLMLASGFVHMLVPTVNAFTAAIAAKPPPV